MTNVFMKLFLILFLLTFPLHTFGTMALNKVCPGQLQSFKKFKMPLDLLDIILHNLLFVTNLFVTKAQEIVLFHPCQRMQE